ncbi:hypothetical protein [Thiobacillus sp.]
MNIAAIQRMSGRAVQALSRFPPLRRMPSKWAHRVKSAILSGACLWLIADAHSEIDRKAPRLFGVFPNMTAKQTLEIYRPLAHEMEKHLRRRVAIHDARDFNAFVELHQQLRIAMQVDPLIRPAH